MDIKQLEREFARMREKIELLAAERGDATRSQSAIRRGELVPLASIGIKSSQVSAAPTMAQHNALQDDVQAIVTAKDQDPLPARPGDAEIDGVIYAAIRTRENHAMRQRRGPALHLLDRAVAGCAVADDDLEITRGLVGE